MIYKIIKYGIILIVWIVVLKLAFHDFKPEYLISWNAFSNWWIDTYAGLFKMILSIILGITLIWGIGWLLRGSIQNVAWTKCRTKYVKPLVHR